jgi:DNA-binding MarR family transcriptional regulator
VIPEPDEDSTDLMRAVLALGRALRRARGSDGVSLACISILATLRRLGPLPAAQLAAEERLAPQSLTRHLGDLLERGYILREKSPLDGRQMLVLATEPGLSALRRDFLARRKWLKQVMDAALSRDERDALMQASALLNKLSRYHDGTS